LLFDLQPATELTIGASPTEASIGKRGEEDVYRFVVANEGRYTLETQGRTDVVMALFGPDTLTNLIARSLPFSLIMV
jgi:hypothetical protein